MAKSAAGYLLAVTGQGNLDKAILYLAEGHYLGAEVDRSKVLRALCDVKPTDLAKWEGAVQKVARDVTRSGLNTAAVLLAPDLITPPSVYRRALDLLASKCPGRSLRSGMDFKAVQIAQEENPQVMPTLLAVAGIAWNDLLHRVTLEGPTRPDARWSTASIQKAFAVISEVICSVGPVGIVNGIQARPIELMGDPSPWDGQKTGWEHIEAFRVSGIPYEVLLAQRVEGGAWRTHRDRTGSKFGLVIAETLCLALASAGVAFLRTRVCGGATTATKVNELLGGGEDQAALILLTAGEKPFAVVGISLANDPGSASKSGAKFQEFPSKVNAPAMLVVAGPGWSGRNETASVAKAFGGRVFSDDRIDEFVKAALEMREESE